MQFTVLINQVKALEWGLNAQQAMMFGFLHGLPTWANAVTVSGSVYYAVSKSKIVEELPLLTDKPDTAYRILKALELVEVIELSDNNKITLVRLTEKGKEWNRSEKNPIYIGKKSDAASEKSPTNQRTNNQSTNQEQNPCLPSSDECFMEQVRETYNRICGGTFQVAIALNPKRKANIKALLSLKVNGIRPFRDHGIPFWEAFFTDCLGNPHWRGENSRNWKAHLEFLTRTENATRVLESSHVS